MTRNGSSRAAKWTCVSPCLEVALTLVEKAGDFINDKLWHRIVQVVTNARELHEPAARSALAKLRAGMCHEMLVKAGAYFLGEFGHTLGGAMGAE